MRVALVSPYSWTYPGGVTRHIEALRAELDRAGHDVRVFAPFDPDRRRTAVLHRGARPQAREVPEWLTPLGPTDRLAVERRRVERSRRRRARSPAAARAARGRLRRRSTCRSRSHRWRAGTRSRAPTCRWSARSTATRSPLLPHKIGALLGARRKLNRLSVSIAVSEAAAWTGRRFYGGRYRIIPNGVVAARRRRAGAARAGRRASRCGSCSSARPSSARACRCCCAPSRRCAVRSRRS